MSIFSRIYLISFFLVIADAVEFVLATNKIANDLTLA